MKETVIKTDKAALKEVDNITFKKGDISKGEYLGSSDTQHLFIDKGKGFGVKIDPYHKTITEALSECEAGQQIKIECLGEIIPPGRGLFEVSLIEPETEKVIPQT